VLQDDTSPRDGNSRWACGAFAETLRRRSQGPLLLWESIQRQPQQIDHSLRLAANSTDWDDAETEGARRSRPALYPSLADAGRKGLRCGSRAGTHLG
jgi:hypothetical protein